MGFKTGIEENGLKFNESFVSIDKKLRLNKTTNAYNFMSEWIKSGKQIPEVFVCSSDLVAIGIMSALRKEEFRVPEDVGIVGFDDCAFAAHAYPPLTTIAQNMTLLGKTCFNTLIKSINETSHAGNQTVLKAKIVVRESVKL